MTTFLKTRTSSSKQHQKNLSLKELYQRRNFYKEKIETLEKQIVAKNQLIARAKSEKNDYVYSLHLIEKEIQNKSTYQISNYKINYIYWVMLFTLLITLYLFFV